MKAVVLAGGAGIALRPLTADRPAALLPVVDRPVVEHLLEHLVRHRVTEAAVALHHCPYPVEARLGDGTRWGLALGYALERRPLGTAGAARRVAARWTEPFLLAYGTALTAVDLGKVVARHAARGAVLTLVVAPTRDGAGGFDLEDDATIRRDGQRPDGLVFTGLAVCDPRAFALLRPGERSDLVDDLLPRLLAARLPVHGYATTEPTLLIRSLADLAAANRRALAGEFPGLVVPGYEVERGIWLSHGARVHREARLVPPVLVGRNALVGRGAVVENAVVGDEVILAPRAAVRDAVLLPRTHVGPGLRLEHAVVDRDRLGRPATGGWTALADPRLLGDTRAPIVRRPASLAGRLAAAGLLVAAAPLWLPCLLGVAVETGGRPLRARRVVGARNRVTRLLDVRARGPIGRLIRRLGLAGAPRLWSVARGDLHWVGVHPRPLVEGPRPVPAAGWPAAPPGLLTLADLAPAPLRRADRLAFDRLYAATRSRRGDLALVATVVRRRLLPAVRIRRA